MASTYVNNLRLEEIGTGEQSGTWGDTTNTNMEIIGQAVAWGTRAIANASTDNITIADGALDADRCLGLKLTGGGQACTVTLLPNTSSKTWFMYNATAAALTFTCGSGANVIIPAGQTKVIATDGLGTGGVVHDLLTAVNLAGTTVVDDLTVTDDLIVGGDIDLEGSIDVNGTTNLDAVDIDGAVQIDATLSVGVDDTGYDVKFFGDTASAFMLWDASADDLILGGAAKMGIGTTDTDGGILVVGSAVSGDTSLIQLLRTGVTERTNFIGLSDSDALVISADEDNEGSDSNIRFKVDGSETLKIDASGNIIIANTGGTLSTTTAGTSNLRLGANAGEDLASGALKNTLIGDNAGANVSTSDYNTAVGFESLNTETVHGRATAMGYRALYLNAPTEISYNVAVGYAAGVVNSTGIHNTFIGGNAGVSNTVGQDNTAVGFEALQTNIGGTGSTAVGRRALYSQSLAAASTAGLKNTGLGFNAGYYISTGTFNTALGVNSLGTGISTANTGGSNVAVGASAGLVLRGTAAANTIVGFEAGKTLTSPSFLTLVGYHAGYTNATGVELTAVGYESMFKSTATGNTGVGYRVGRENVGDDNTFMGAFAGYSSTSADGSVGIGFNACGGTGTMTGNSNTAVGFYAGTDLTSANNTTIVGASAGLNVTSSDQSTFVGASSASASAVTGNRNNAFGYLAGEDLTSGTNNVFMGSYSGKGISTGISNTVCGEAALITESSGDKNTAIGAEALKAQNGGRDGNVAVGYYAGFALTTGERNTIIGTEAMSLSAITSNENVAVGYKAGRSITTGAANVLIGKFAGADTTLLTTGTQNVIIGPLARPSAADVNNEVVIGYFVGGSGEGTATIGNGNGKISVDFEANATWSYSSDERLKKDIVADDLGLSFINRLETVKYKWKPSNEIDESLPQYVDASSSIENTRKTDVVMHGMIAQTVKAALDAENVDTFAGWSEDLDGTQKISREMFVSPLIKAVQELSTALDAALARIAVLEG